MISFAFDDKNAAAQKVAADQAARMVTDISAETEANIRQLIEQAIRDGVPPYQAAKEIKELIGLTAAQGQAAAKYRDELEAQAVLTASQIDTQVTDYADELLDERADMIARTEIMDALNTGQEEAWSQAQDEGLLTEDATMEWITTPDEKLCPECDPMDGETVPVGEEFPEGNPPLHPNCRCTVGIATP